MRILLIRTSALGDIVHALPVLAALRRRFAGAEVAWVVERSLAPLLAGHADLDRILTVDLRGWRRAATASATRRAVGAAVRELRAFRADVALELMGNHKGGILARLSGAPVRIGARRADRREPSSAAWINRPVALRGTHAVERTLSLLSGLGYDSEPVDFTPGKLLPETPAEVRAWLAIRSGRPFVFIHPGAAWGNKRYPPKAWSEVVRVVRARCGTDVVVGAAPGEQHLATAIASASGGDAEVVGAPSLAHLGAILRAAEAAVGGDTGPMHLAHALGTRVLMLMGPTDPARHGPFAAPAGALAQRLPCSFCYKRLPDSQPCMLAHEPAIVAERIQALLAGRRSAGLC